ncbi:caspase recruitment domain-containing protein 19 isoform X1 [Chiloscyllium punctatum]|uniref:caspase recruitment domain-containing protein 19 isoform X1 n=1 Tax=Chiloscyllium punctatum TaxID=137246 RepID=UPI003B63BB22
MNTLKLLYWKLQASCLHEETLLNYCKRLEKDTQFLTNEGTLSEKLVDRIVLHLYRIYPQILNNTEAEMFRNVNTPVCIRISELLLHLQKKSNRACKEFYNALETNDAQIYKKLPSKYLARTITSMGINMDTYNREKYILNDRGPVFFLACFSVAAGLAFLLYYCKEDIKVENTAKKIIGFSSLGVGRRARRLQEMAMSSGKLLMISRAGWHLGYYCTSAPQESSYAAVLPQSWS